MEDMRGGNGVDGEEGAEEWVLCSAIWFDDGRVYGGQPVNIKSGFVVLGHRHFNVYAELQTLLKFLGCDEEEIKKFLKIEKAQGFLTSKNRFVNREEAYKIALRAGQVEEKDDKRLFSEDLY